MFKRFISKTENFDWRLAVGVAGKHNEVSVMRLNNSRGEDEIGEYYYAMVSESEEELERAYNEFVSVIDGLVSKILHGSEGKAK